MELSAESSVAYPAECRAEFRYAAPLKESSAVCPAESTVEFPAKLRDGSPVASLAPLLGESSRTSRLIASLSNRIPRVNPPAAKPTARDKTASACQLANIVRSRNIPRRLAARISLAP